MISWLQNNFQRHYKILFFGLLAVVIVAFVFTIGAVPGFEAGQKIARQPFFGYNLASQEDATRIFDDARLSLYLQVGHMGFDSEELQEYGLQRVAGLALADRYGIPSPGQEELTRFISQLRAFHDFSGNFDPGRYSAFVDQVRANPQMTQGDVTRVLRGDLRLERVQDLLGGPGYVLPAEVRHQLVRADTIWTVEVASLAYDNFQPAISPEESDLEGFYSENPFRYEVPPRIEVSYIEFPLEPYLAEVRFTEQELLAFYRNNRFRFPAPPEEDTSESLELNVIDDERAELEKVRPAVEEALRRELAEKHAARAASDFSYLLFEQQVPPNSPALDAFLAARRLQPQQLPPFTQQEPPADMNWPRQVFEEAFRLGEHRYFSDPLRVNGGMVVLLWNRTHPAYLPALEDVREQVAADFIESERRRLFTARGQSLQASLAERVRSGESFREAAASEGMEVAEYDSFSRRQPPAGFNPSVLSVLERLEPGSVSPMVTVEGRGHLVYAAARQTPDVTEANREYLTTREQIMRMSSNLNQNLYLMELIEDELTRANLSLR